jgi:hypothetical protein
MQCAWEVAEQISVQRNGTYAAIEQACSFRDPNPAGFAGFLWSLPLCSSAFRLQL